MQVMYFQALLANNVLLSIALNVNLGMLLNVTNVQIIFICILLEIVIYAMMDVKNVMEVETAPYVRMDTTYLDMKMAQWFVKAASQVVEIVNTGQVNVQSVCQDFIWLQIRHVAPVNQGVGNVILLKDVFNVMKPKLWYPLHVSILFKNVRLWQKQANATNVWLAINWIRQKTNANTVYHLLW